LNRLRMLLGKIVPMKLLNNMHMYASFLEQAERRQVGIDIMGVNRM